VAEEEFAAQEKAGKILHSTSPWASPLYLAPKEDGSCWPYSDFRRLNTITVPNRHLLPNLMDLSTNMEGCTVFSKIDLVKAFHQVPIATEDRQKTAVITPLGLFENNYMLLLKASNTPESARLVCFTICALYFCLFK
jgi:hypothetical protein